MLFVHWCLSTQPILNSTVPWLRTPQDLITSHIVRVVMNNLRLCNSKLKFIHLLI